MKGTVCFMEEKNAEKQGQHSFALLITLSLIIMVVAFAMIYMYTRQYNPDVLQVNAQSESASQNEGFVNTESPQVLETQATGLNIQPFADSGIYIIGAGVFMLVIIVSFGIVKYVERKDE